MKAPRSFETSISIYPTRQCHIPEDTHNPHPDNPASRPVNVLTNRRNKPLHPCKPNIKLMLWTSILKPGIAVDVMATERAGGLGFESRQRRDFLSIPKPPHRLWGYTSLLFCAYRGSFPGTKRPGREVRHSPPSSAQVHNEWSCTPTPQMTPCLGQGKLTRLLVGNANTNYSRIFNYTWRRQTRQVVYI
jgi:hypothetical protein